MISAKTFNQLMALNGDNKKPYPKNKNHQSKSNTKPKKDSK
jgi:hypothetical protein